METIHYFPELREESLKSVSLREEDVVLLKRLKNVLVRSQLYAEAAYLRDLEKRFMEIIEAMAQHGFKPRPAPESEEKVYTLSEVTTMLNLATTPLKKTINHYEELSRTAIVDHVATLMKVIDEQRKEINELKQTQPDTPSKKIEIG